MGIVQELTCAFCNDVVKDPVTLECFHHLCESCVTELTNQEPVFACPLCNEECSIPEGGLKVDTVKKIVVDHVRKALKPDSTEEDVDLVNPPITCAYCEERVATRRCVECHGQPLCEDCQKSTHSKGYFRSHTIVDIGEALGATEKEDVRMVCCEHDQKLEFYCLTCRTPVCSHCLIIKGHKGHEHTTIDAAYNTGKDTLSAWIQKMKDRISTTQALYETFQAQDEEVTKHGESQRNTVNYEMDHLRELIETKRRQLLQKSALEEKQKRLQLQTQMEKAQSARDQAQHLVNRSEDLLELSSIHAFVVLVLVLIQDMRICNSQPTDDHRRVSTAFRALHTDNQVRVLGDLDLGQPPVQILGGVHQVEAPPAMVVQQPFQGSSATTMPYVPHPVMHGHQVLHPVHFRPSLPPQ